MVQGAGFKLRVQSLGSSIYQGDSNQSFEVVGAKHGL
jgi:hypothetical protein